MDHRRELLSAIYERPGDDALREVLADTLEEEGDPRGLFIRLQLARRPRQRPTDREERLLEGNELSWLDDLRPCAAPSRHRYERGFVSTLAINNLAPRFADHPAWSTVHELVARRVASDRPLEGLLSSPSMRGLERIRGLDVAHLGQLSSTRAALPLRAVNDVRYTVPGDVVDVLHRLHCLPRLRALSLRVQATPFAPDDLHDLLGSTALSVVRQLRLPVRLRAHPRDAHREALLRAPRSLREVQLYDSPTVMLVFRRNREGAWEGPSLADETPVSPRRRRGPRRPSPGS